MELKSTKGWPQVLTPEQVAEYLQLSTDEVIKLLSSGQIPGIQLGGQWRVHLASLDQWLNSQMIPQNAKLPPIKNPETDSTKAQFKSEAQAILLQPKSASSNLTDFQTSTQNNPTRNPETQSIKPVSNLSPIVAAHVEKLLKPSPESYASKTKVNSREAERNRGVVHTYYPNRGIGFIKDEEGRNIYVEALDIEGFGTSLRVNDIVEFILESRPRRGYVAKKVKILSTIPKARKILSGDSRSQTLSRTRKRSWERLYKDALAARQQGHIAEARQLFEEALEAGGPNKNVFEAYAAMEKEQKHLNRAMAILERGLKALPGEGMLYEFLAMLLKQDKAPERAAEVLRAGLKSAPKHAKALHFALANVLVEIGGDSNLIEAANHAEEAKKAGMFLKDDPRYRKIVATTKPITREALEFFKKAGFELARKVDPTGRYVDLFMSSENAEYQETYNLTDKIRVRCFFSKVFKNDIYEFLEDIRSPYPGFKTNNDIGFLVLDDVTPWLYHLGKILEENPEVIVPVDRKAQLRRILDEDVTISLRQILDQWLAKRDLFDRTLPVVGRRFFGRTEELLNLTRNIEDGQSVAIYGLRKTGKTSLLYQIKEKRPRDLVVYISLEDITDKDCAQLYWKIARSLQQDIYEKSKTLGFTENDTTLKLGSVTEYLRLAKSQERNALLFDEDMTDLLNRLSGNEMTALSKIVIAIDELELMLPIRGSGFKGYADFFRHIRGIVQRTQGRVVSIIAAASHTINEQALWEGLDNPMFQFYKEMFLPLLKEEECKEMIKKLGQGMGVLFDPESLECIYGETGGHPYITRQLCSHIVRNKPRPLKVNRQLVLSHIDTFISEKFEIFSEIFDRLHNSFQEAKELLLVISRGITTMSELVKSMNISVDRALWHLMEYQIIDFRNDVYRVKINLLHRWLSKYYPGV